MSKVDITISITNKNFHGTMNILKRGFADSKTFDSTSKTWTLKQWGTHDRNWPMSKLIDEGYVKVVTSEEVTTWSCWECGCSYPMSRRPASIDPNGKYCGC